MNETRLVHATEEVIVESLQCEKMQSIIKMIYVAVKTVSCDRKIEFFFIITQSPCSIEHEKPFLKVGFNGGYSVYSVYIVIELYTLSCSTGRNSAVLIQSLQQL